MNTQPPTVRQYMALKREAPIGSVLLYQVGDFYGIFGKENIDDIRQILSLPDSLLDKAFLPTRNLDTYLAKLIRNSKTVALADYADNMARGKLMRREITRVIAPGIAKEVVS